MELRKIFQIPRDILKLLILYFKNWLISQREYLELVLVKLSTCGWRHMRIYMLPFFESSIIPDSIKPQAINIIAQREIRSSHPLELIFRAYFGFKQTYPHQEKALQDQIVTRLRPEGGPFKAPIVVGTLGKDCRGCDIITIQILYYNGIQKEELWPKKNETRFEISLGSYKMGNIEKCFFNSKNTRACLKNRQ